MGRKSDRTEIVTLGVALTVVAAGCGTEGASSCKDTHSCGVEAGGSAGEPSTGREPATGGSSSAGSIGGKPKGAGGTGLDTGPKAGTATDTKRTRSAKGVGGASQGPIGAGGVGAASECQADSDCDDGLDCTGTETCVDGSCEAGSPPCLTADPDHCQVACKELADGHLCFEVALDKDGDGYGTAACAKAKPPGDDCDDSDPSTHPGAEEVCDGVDNDCNGAKDVDDGLPVAAVETEYPHWTEPLVAWTPTTRQYAFIMHYERYDYEWNIGFLNEDASIDTKGLTDPEQYLVGLGIYPSGEAMDLVWRNGTFAAVWAHTAVPGGVSVVRFGADGKTTPADTWMANHNVYGSPAYMASAARTATGDWFIGWRTVRNLFAAKAPPTGVSAPHPSSIRDGSVGFARGLTAAGDNLMFAWKESGAIQVAIMAPDLGKTLSLQTLSNVAPSWFGAPHLASAGGTHLVAWPTSASIGYAVLDSSGTSVCGAIQPDYSPPPQKEVDDIVLLRVLPYSTDSYALLYGVELYEFGKDWEWEMMIARVTSDCQLVSAPTKIGTSSTGIGDLAASDSDFLALWQEGRYPNAKLVSKRAPHSLCE